MGHMIKDENDPCGLLKSLARKEQLRTPITLTDFFTVPEGCSDPEAFLRSRKALATKLYESGKTGYPNLFKITDDERVGKREVQMGTASCVRTGYMIFRDKDGGRIEVPVYENRIF